MISEAGTRTGVALVPLEPSRPMPPPVISMTLFRVLSRLLVSAGTANPEVPGLGEYICVTEIDVA